MISLLMMNSQLKEVASVFAKNSVEKKAQISLVGDLALDRFVVGHVDRISPEAPVPVLLVEKEFEELGCAANVVRNVGQFFPLFRALFMNCTGIMGVDSAALRLKQNLEKLSPHQLKLEIFNDPTRPTSVKTRYIAGSTRSQHQLLRVDVESIQPISKLLRDRVFQSIVGSLKSIQVLVLQDYAKGLFDKEFLQKIIGAAKKEKVFTIVDPNRRTEAQAYAGASLITPNVEEAESLLGRSLHRGENDGEIAEACIELKEKLSLDVSMITRGRFGLSFCDQNSKVSHISSMARGVSDVTGAGDTLVAVLAVCMSLGAEIDFAARLANVAAGVVVGKSGTAVTNWEEMMKELQSEG